MSIFSNLDTALQEKSKGRGRKSVTVNSLGVCLDDTGQPVQLYIVDTVYACGSLDVFSLDKENPFYDSPRKVQACDFWALM